MSSTRKRWRNARPRWPRARPTCRVREHRASIPVRTLKGARARASKRVVPTEGKRGSLYDIDRHGVRGGVSSHCLSSIAHAMEPHPTPPLMIHSDVLIPEDTSISRFYAYQLCSPTSDL